jgi:hypothetical protein
MKKLKNIKSFNEHQENLNISDVSKRYLVKYVDGSWFEHETEVDAIDEDDAIKQVEKQCRNASHFAVSEL